MKKQDQRAIYFCQDFKSILLYAITIFLSAIQKYSRLCDVLELFLVLDFYIMTKLLWYKKSSMMFFGQNVNPLMNEEIFFGLKMEFVEKKANLGLSSRFKHGPLNTFFVIAWKSERCFKLAKNRFLNTKKTYCFIITLPSWSLQIHQNYLQFKKVLLKPYFWFKTDWI